MSDAQIFQVFGILYTSVGIGILINRQFYTRLFEEFTESPAALYLGGVLALVIGYLIVAFHNTWIRDLSVIITIIGWMALIKGILILVQPKIIIAIIKAMIKSKKALIVEAPIVEAILIIIIGVALASLGFCPKSPI